MSDQTLREHLVALLQWKDAHADIDRIVERIPQDRWSATAPGLPHSLWQLLEHVRLAQHDILDFCRNPGYTELRWPDDYWPPASAQPTAEQMTDSLAALQQDREALMAMARDPTL